jgi:hypothetical protein
VDPLEELYNEDGAGSGNAGAAAAPEPAIEPYYFLLAGGAGGFAAPGVAGGGV